MCPEPRAFTITYDIMVKQLVSEVFIFPSFDIDTTDKLPRRKKFEAIWDTGATGSVISKRVVTECGLKRISIVNVHTVSGQTRAPVYLVDMILPNNVGITALRVTEGSLGVFDVLIGMDIIRHGDFAVISRDGKTTFSFRFPSTEDIDFVRQKPNLP